MERNLWLDSDTARSLRLPVLVTGLLWTAGTFPPIFYGYSVALCLFVSVAVGGLSVLLFTPIFETYLGWWRKAFYSREFWLSNLGLNLLLFFWNFSLTALVWALLEFSGGAPWPDLISSLDMPASQLSTVKMTLFFIFGFLAAVGSRILFANDLKFESAGKGLWWLGGLLLCIWILIGGYVARLGWLGWTLDRDLREVVERDSLNSFLELLYYGKERDFFPLLPAEFREAPGVEEAIFSNNQDARLQTLRVWLGVVRQRMSQEHYWQDQELQNLVLLGDLQYRPRNLGAQGIEIGLAADLVLLDSQFFWIDMTVEDLAQHEADVDFLKLVDLILTRQDLHLAPALDIPTTSRAFVEKYNKHHPEPFSTVKLLPFFAALEARTQLNLEWRRFKSGLPYPTRPPLSKDEVRSDAGLYSLVLEQQGNRTSMVALLLYLELKGLKQKGQPLPRKWGDFRPEIERIGRAHEGWIDVEFENEGVRISRFGLRSTNPDVLWVPRNSESPDVQTQRLSGA